MCPQSNPGRDKQFLKKMSLTDFERVVAECAEHGLNVVNLEGSGEPTLNRNLAEYVKIVKKYGAKAYIFTNGHNLDDRMMREVVDAGIDFVRFSVIGYDQLSYLTWMRSDSFMHVRENARRMVDYVQRSKADTVVGSYHLILDPSNTDFEVEAYRNNFIEVAGTVGDIWRMHNWSGVYKPEYGREGKVKTCGRPFSPDLVIRAGGIDGHKLAVHPCCQVLGNDTEAVLGHLDDQSIEEVWTGDAYTKLREQHTTGMYPDYCKGCDFLIDDPEVLVWSNGDASLHKMKGTQTSLHDYR